MNLHPDVESELAAGLELIERGEPRGVSREPVTAEVIDLLHLAHQIRTLPPIQPDSRWLASSKSRLMARFAALQAQGQRRADGQSGR